MRAAAAHDYAALYHAEIETRRRAGYPPFGRLARIVYEHTNLRHAEEEMTRIARELREERDRRGIPGVQVIGPAPALHSKLKGRWRWQLVLRAADPASFAWRPPPYEYEHRLMPIDILAGSERLRTAIERGERAGAIAATWHADEDVFRALRTPYLRYA